MVQEAIASKNIEILSYYLEQTKDVVNKKFEERIPQAIRALHEVSDLDGR